MNGLIKIFTVFIIIHLSFPLIAQEEDYRKGAFTEVPDSFLTTTADVHYLAHLDSIKGEFYKTFPALNLTILYHYEKYDDFWYFAIKEENGYVVFNPLLDDRSADELIFPEADSMLVDVNEDGFPELMISWNNYLGHTGWENAIHERFGGVLLWYIKNHVCLMDFDNYYQLESWWTKFEEDTTETLSYEEREVIDSGGDFECDYYIVGTAPGSVSIKWSPTNCNEDKEENTELFIPNFLYDFTEKGILKLKK